MAQERKSHCNAIERIKKRSDQKLLAGAYAVRCASTGEVWVGTSRNLDAMKNGCWFMLRSGSHQEKSLQAEWNARGEKTFEYEVLEALGEDVHSLNIAALLKEMKSAWVARLSATPLL
jgi:hypothetical protein